MSVQGSTHLHSPLKPSDPPQPPKNRQNSPRAKLTKTQSNLILITIMLFNVGYWSAIAFPQALGDTFLKKFHITTKEVGYIYSITFMCSIILCPLIGVVISRFGIPNIALLLSLCIFTGNLVTYFGVRGDSFGLLLFGRFLFSLGAETILIAQNSASEKWFSRRLLSISMGVNSSCGVAFGSLSNFLTPILMVEDRNLEIAFLYHAYGGAISCLSVALFNILDWKYAGLLQNQLDEDASKNSKIDSEGPQELTEDNRIGQIAQKSTENKSKNNKKYVFEINHLWKLGPLYWSCVGIYTFASNAYFQFTKVITNTIVHRFGYSYLKAKNFYSIIQISSAVLMPLNSILIQNHGRKLKVLLFATASLLVAYTLMLLSPATPSLSFSVAIVFVILFQITYQTTIFPSLAMCLPRDAVSIGFGIASFVQCLFLTALPPVLGSIIQDETVAKFQIILFVFLAMAGIGGLWVLVTMRIDFKLGGILDAPENSEKAQKGRARLDARFKRLVALGRSAGRTGAAGAVTIGDVSENRSSNVVKVGRTFGES